MMRVPELMIATLQERVHIPPSLTAHVSVKVLTAQRAAVLHAATGMGKTFVASVLSLQRTVYCVVHPNSCRQWIREAAKVGVEATWIDTVQTLNRCVSSLAERPHQMLIISHTMTKCHKFRQAKESLPKPELLIIDEVHTDFSGAALGFIRSFGEVFKLGMTATMLTAGQQGSIAHILGLDPRALPAATITVPQSANTAIYPDVQFDFQQVAMRGVERYSYTVTRDIGTGVI